MVFSSSWISNGYPECITTTLCIMVPFGMIQRMPIILEIHTPFGIIRNVKVKKSNKKMVRAESNK